MKFVRLLKSSLPNENSLGEPIANNEQTLQNFWNWFNGSQVVDKQGRPLVVYHGGAKFNTFETSYDGKYYFTDNKQYAQQYADDYIDDYGRKGNGELKSIYLKITNPAPFEKIDKLVLDQRIDEGYDGEIIKSFEGNIYCIYYPNQAKSISNNTNYSKEDNSIYGSKL